MGRKLASGDAFGTGKSVVNISETAIFQQKRKIFQKKSSIVLQNEKNVVPLQSKTQAGCSSARLEYASGGRVVAGSNPVTPTGKSLENRKIFEAFAFLSAPFSMPFAGEPLSYRDLVCIFAAIPYRSDAGALFLLHRLLSIKIEKGNIYETLS